MQPTSVIMIFCFEHFLEFQWARSTYSTVSDKRLRHTAFNWVWMSFCSLRFVPFVYPSIVTCNIYISGFCYSFHYVRYVYQLTIKCAHCTLCTDHWVGKIPFFCILSRSMWFLSAITIILSFSAIFSTSKCRVSGVGCRRCDAPQRYTGRLPGSHYY